MLVHRIMGTDSAYLVSGTTRIKHPTLSVPSFGTDTSTQNIPCMAMCDHQLLESSVETLSKNVDIHLKYTSDMHYEK